METLIVLAIILAIGFLVFLLGYDGPRHNMAKTRAARKAAYNRRK